MSLEQNHLSGNEHTLRIQTTPDRIVCFGCQPHPQKSWILGIYNPFRKGHTNGFLGMICLTD